MTWIISYIVFYLQPLTARVHVFISNVQIGCFARLLCECLELALETIYDFYVGSFTCVLSEWTKEESSGWDAAPPTGGGDADVRRSAGRAVAEAGDGAVVGGRRHQPRNGHHVGAGRLRLLGLKKRLVLKTLWNRRKSAAALNDWHFTIV